MNEEEIMKRAEEAMQDWEQDDELIQNLLDLYNQEKEKNKKLEEVIDMMAEDISISNITNWEFGCNYEIKECE